MASLGETTAQIKITTKGDTSGIESTRMSFLSMASAVAVGQAAFAGMEKVAGAVEDVFKSSLSAYSESQQVVSQLGAVLASTAGKSGVTKDAAIALSKELENQTTISDESALSAENMMLTFTNVGKKVFPDATKAAVDMAYAMNGGLTPSMEQIRDRTVLLGKALQDPDAGLGALHRVGVNVDELKKQFTANMSVMDKQKLILKELGTEFGGSGAAAATTYAGKVLQIKEKVNDMQESIGEAIVKAVTPFVNKLADFVKSDRAQALIQAISKEITILITRMGDWITKVAIPWVEQHWPAIKAAIKQVWDVVKGLWTFFDEHKWILEAVAGGIIAIKSAIMLNGLYQAFLDTTAIIASKGGFIPALEELAVTLGPTALLATAIAGIVIDVGLLVKTIQTAIDLFHTLQGLKANNAQTQANIDNAQKQYNALSVDKKNSTAGKNLLNSINQQKTGLTGQTGSIAGAAFMAPGDAVVSFFTKLFGGHATGGSVLGGRPTVIGEKGPELFVPSSSGSIIPNDKLSRVGSSKNVTIHQTNNYSQPQDPYVAARALGFEMKLRLL